MGLKKCEKCGENVDDAKAFCPDCGNPFVEEKKREGSSEFDDFAGTLKYSETAYFNLLSEMELDTSKQTKQEIKPIPTPGLEKKTVSTEKAPPEKTPPKKVQKPGKRKWVILAVFGTLGLIVLILTVAVVLIYLYFSRF